jgi:hypothetical protein
MHPNLKINYVYKMGLSFIIILIMPCLLTCCATTNPVKIKYNQIDFHVINIETLKNDMEKYHGRYSYFGTLDKYHLFSLASKTEDGRAFLRFAAIKLNECDVCEPFKLANNSKGFTHDLSNRTVQIVGEKCAVKCLNK